MTQPTKQQIRSWINRQRTRPNPSPVYIEWLRKQFRITATAQVVKNQSKSDLFLTDTINTVQGD